MAELDSKNNNPYVCYCDQLLWKIRFRKLCRSLTNGVTLKASSALHKERGEEQDSLPAFLGHLHGLLATLLSQFSEKSLSFFFLLLMQWLFLVHSLLNECTGCFWHALSLHAFLMIYKEKSFSSLSLFLPPPPFLLPDSLFLSLKK